MLAYRDAKTMAKAMREALAARNLTISHSEALEIVARQFGLATWNILSAKIDAPAGPEGNDHFERTAPIVRIFDVARAHEFYLGYLGFAVDWEHRYGATSRFIRRSRAATVLHLSEHAGDATPGGNMVVYMKGIRDFHKELAAKDYRYMRPGLEQEDGRLTVEVIDPFGNHIRFMELTGE